MPKTDKPTERAAMHAALDRMFDLGLTTIVAGKEPRGGVMFAHCGNRRTVIAMLRELYKRFNNGKEDELWSAK